MPKLNELHDNYKDKGLVLIGVHTTNGKEKMEAFAKEQGIKYPIAADIGKKTVAAFSVDSFPDYYVIDRSGKLRVADLANGDLERAVKVLLKESGGPKTDKPKLSELDASVLMKEALAKTKKTHKRILVHVGGPG